MASLLFLIYKIQLLAVVHTRPHWGAYDAPSPSNRLGRGIPHPHSPPRHIQHLALNVFEKHVRTSLCRKQTLDVLQTKVLDCPYVIQTTFRLHP